jgi:hypothetical protein
MTMARSLGVVLCCLLFAAVLGTSACVRISSEEALREALGTLQQALEDRDAVAFGELLAEDFIGPDGLDRQAARRLAAVSWMQHRRVGVTLGAVEVEIGAQDRHGTVRFTAALTGGSGRLLPASAQVYDVETGWRFEQGQWRMTSAAWTPKF